MSEKAGGIFKISPVFYVSRTESCSYPFFQNRIYGWYHLYIVKDYYTFMTNKTERKINNIINESDLKNIIESHFYKLTYYHLIN